MSITILLIDCPAPYLRSAQAHQGVLTLPLGVSSVLDCFIGALGELVEKEILITPCFAAQAGYEEAIASNTRHPVRALDSEALHRALHDFETSDYLLIVSSRHWVVGGYDPAAIRRAMREYHGATYGVAVGSNRDDTRELVEYDTDGRVKRVQRFYNTVSWPEVATTAVSYALVPARSIVDIPFGSLGDLRCGMAARGMLGSDVALQSDTLDLTVEGEFLALHERLLNDAAGQKLPAGFSARAPGVLVGGNCKVHGSARLIPPIILQSDVTIEKGATVIGPALIGRGSRISENASVAQCVLVHKSIVPADRIVRHRVTSGTIKPDDEIAPQVEPAVDSHDAADSMQDLQVVGSASRALGGYRLHLFGKRVMDVVLSFIALLLLSPLLLLVVVLIKLDSRGPVFFTHRRERRGGKDFPCIKFRTMVAGAHNIQRDLYKDNEVDGPQFKMREDPRVTRVGRWLRATNIDELPQLINVLLGHMSLVGPRPSPFRENQICVPWRRARLSVRPGITGLWQICRDDERATGNFHQWIYYDIAYVRHFSLWLDIKILIATVLVLGGRWRVPLSWMVRRASRDVIYPREPLAA